MLLHLPRCNSQDSPAPANKGLSTPNAGSAEAEKPALDNERLLGRTCEQRFPQGRGA